MATLFTRIIQGEIPGHFIHRDERAVVFLSIHPLAAGHALVVPCAEVDHWLDLDPDLAAHLFQLARIVGQAQMKVFRPVRIGLMIAGLEVPHTHIHVVPINGPHDLDFARANPHVTQAELATVAESLRSALSS